MCCCCIDDPRKIKVGQGLKYPEMRMSQCSMFAFFQHREILGQNNPAVLHLVESAMFHFVIDDVTIEVMKWKHANGKFNFTNVTSLAQENSAACKRLLTGDGTDRWFDKCFTTSVMNNAWGGHNVEHSAIDAMVSI
jgi:carnitine O-palmitoyltransferase 1